MSNHEKSNTIKTPETSEQLTDPAEIKLAADSALDLTIDSSRDHTQQLQQDVETFLSNSDFSYDNYGFPSPTEIIQRERGGARAARAFIQSRRLNDYTPAIVKLADEIYLRESGRKSQRSARSDEYLQTLLDDCKAVDTATNLNEDISPEETAEASSYDIDEESVSVRPVIRLQPAAPVSSPTAKKSDSHSKQPTPSVAVRIAAVEQQIETVDSQTIGELSPEKSQELVDLKTNILRIEREVRILNEEIALAQNDPSVNPNDELTIERQSRLGSLILNRDKLLSKLEENQLTPELLRHINKQARSRLKEDQENETDERREKIEAILSPKPTVRQQRRQDLQQEKASLKSDVEFLSQYRKSLELSGDHKRVSDLLSKHARKIGTERLSRVSHMAYLVERKWRNHPIHSELDKKEQRQALDEVLFAENGMLLKMFTANNLDYEKMTPKQLYDIVFDANSKNTLRSSRIANMGRLATGLIDIGELALGGAAAGLNLIPLPIADIAYYGRGDRRQFNAIAHLDKAAAKRYRTQQQDSKIELSN